MTDRESREQAAVVADGGSRWSAIISVVGFVLCGIAFFLMVQAIGPDRLQDWVVSAGPLAPVAYVLLKAATLIVTPLSGTPLRLAAGVLFGFWEGVALSVLAGVLGGSANFWIARRYGRGVVARLLGPRTLARVEPMLDRLADWRALALARVVLAPLWDVLSYGVGLTRLRYRTYLAVAFIGDLIPTMILVGVGSSVMEVGVMETGASGAQSVQAALPMLALLAVAGIAVLVLAGAAALLRPRLMRKLARPVPADDQADGPSAAKDERLSLTRGVRRSKRGVQGAA
ncbi:MAG: TVP38/TMEM64 family protein [Chloroflexota bacterium]